MWIQSDPEIFTYSDQAICLASITMDVAHLTSSSEDLPVPEIQNRLNLLVMSLIARGDKTVPVYFDNILVSQQSQHLE
ncbi:hypothetical protein GJ496_000037 [Pomphorhynchus laevis]|nr:hypothetical protein GJ496_000037 [Pomphorhynchus laevis]